VIPPDFTGAWRRLSLTLGDGEPHEPQAVVWVQARRAFADLRLPVVDGAETNCFAGETTWAAPRLHWHHDVGFEPPGAADEGEVEWDGEDLVERGDFLIDGALVPYVEVWHREPASVGAYLCLRAVEDQPGGGTRVVGRLVQAADHSVAVVDRRADGGGLSACYRRRGADGRWAAVAALGGGEGATPAPPEGEQVAGHVLVLLGLGWTVDEVGVVPVACPVAAPA
jgi:hypothetical protein